jgi:hypothetical protein
MIPAPISLQLLKGSFSVHRLSPQAEVPKAVLDCPFFAVMRTREELSLVLPEEIDIRSDASESGWACFQVLGPLDFNLVGILSTLTAVLAEARVPVFALSTFDTDYLLVKRERVQAAVEAFETAGYIIE